MSNYDKRFIRKTILIAFALFMGLLLLTGRLNALEPEPNTCLPPTCYEFQGKLSRYDFNPWYYTIKWQQEHGRLRSDEEMLGLWSIALSDCSTIGMTGSMVIYKNDVKIETLPVIVFDCLGSDAEHDWMTDYGFAAEMGWALWRHRPHWYNNPAYTAKVMIWK